MSIHDYGVDASEYPVPLWRVTKTAAALEDQLGLHYGGKTLLAKDPRRALTRLTKGEIFNALNVLGKDWTGGGEVYRVRPRGPIRELSITSRLHGIEILVKPEPVPVAYLEDEDAAAVLLEGPDGEVNLAEVLERVLMTPLQEISEDVYAPFTGCKTVVLGKYRLSIDWASTRVLLEHMGPLEG